MMMMERNGTDGATTRFVTFGFGREKRANDDVDDGDDEATTTREGRRFTRRFIHSFIHSFVRARCVSCALARVGWIRSRRRRRRRRRRVVVVVRGVVRGHRLETRVRTSRVDAGSERR